MDYKLKNDSKFRRIYWKIKIKKRKQKITVKRRNTTTKKKGNGGLILIWNLLNENN